MPPLSREVALKRLHDLYQRVASRVAALESRHRERMNCAVGCHGCCQDGLSVFEIEGENIRANHGALLSRDTANTRGGCAFLDGSGACRIYESRPYVCRTHGLPFRWEEWESEGENGALEEEDLNGDLSLAPPKEYRDICPLNAPGEDINALPPEDCLTLGDFEGQLAQIQAERDGWALKRVALRQLFPQPAPPQGGID